MMIANVIMGWSKHLFYEGIDRRMVSIPRTRMTIAINGSNGNERDRSQSFFYVRDRDRDSVGFCQRSNLVNVTNALARFVQKIEVQA